eukprot:2723541-Ditylum_brightwellii.AAC.1
MHWIRAIRIGIVVDNTTVVVIIILKLLCKEIEEAGRPRSRWAVGMGDGSGVGDDPGIGVKSLNSFYTNWSIHGKCRQSLKGCFMFK